jgi:hypothetical protein
MRSFRSLLAYATATVVAAASCAAGSGRGTGGLTGGNAGAKASGAGTSTGGAAGSSANGGSTGTFVIPDGGQDSPFMCPAYKSCNDAGYNCGMAPDGCGNLQNCGTCTAPETCAGSGTQNVCGMPKCTPATCMSLGYDCGMASDGCNGTLSCGTTCPANEVCGGMGHANQCSPGTCVPKTCQQQGFNCGMQGDGCGNAIDCGTCPANQACGGGMNPMNGVCGTVCTPKTCLEQGFNCGAATDGCGNIISCGMCSGNQTCGGGGPNVCGAVGPTCTNLCLKQELCPMMGQTTSISGTVYAPNGVDPLPNTLVYVPNAPLAMFNDGVDPPHCDCSADVSGNPLVSAVTDYKGTFAINNMPVSTNVPLVIQNGRWRRRYTIPSVAACVNTPIPTSGPQQLRMPQKQAEFTPFDNIPRMAIVTGEVDALECALRKLGINDSEFTNPSSGGRVEIYQGMGAPGAAIDATTPSETSLWTTQATINGYDMVYFACQDHQSDNPAAAQTNVLNFANAGGRVFATHFSYTWLYDVNPWMQTAQWYCTTPGCAVDQTVAFSSDPQTGYIDTSFPAGNTLAEWLFYIKASTTMAEMPIQALRDDFKLVNAPTQRWVYVKDPAYAYDKPMHFTFDTPWQAPPASLCGKVLYSDFHVEDAFTKGKTFPQECMQTCLDLANFGACNPADGCVCSGNVNPCKTDADCNAATPQEKMLEYFLFDLGGCVRPATCAPASCAGQNVQCGPASDGCGNIILCGMCPSGQACIAGKCTMGCTPKSCAQQGFLCGMQGDGCGNVQSCGTCPSGTCGGGGMPGVCGSGTCNPKTCSQQNTMCGSVGDGCGNILNCGVCPQGEICGGMTPGKCYQPPCTPKTCAQLGYNCGEATDGCGNIINCGTCVAPQICGGGTPPMANVCGGGAN